MPSFAAIRVGDLVVQPVFDGVATLEPSMFTLAGEPPQPADWSAHAHLLDADGRLRVPVGAFLVRSGEQTVLLDAGVGETNDPMFAGHELLDSLAAIGVAPTDIDVVMVSHLHTDHMGWLERTGAAVFANATIRIGAADWTHFVDKARPDSKRAPRLRAVADHVELIHTDGEAIAPGITARATPGHTPGHTSVVLSSGTERLLVLGDALHCPAQLTESEWQFFFDVDRDLASRTRAALLREAEEPSTALLPAHFPGMRSARLVEGAGRRQWQVG